MDHAVRRVTKSAGAVNFHSLALQVLCGYFRIARLSELRFGIILKWIGSRSSPPEDTISCDRPYLVGIHNTTQSTWMILRRDHLIPIAIVLIPLLLPIPPNFVGGFVQHSQMLPAPGTSLMMDGEIWQSEILGVPAFADELLLIANRETKGDENVINNYLALRADRGAVGRAVDKSLRPIGADDTNVTRVLPNQEFEHAGRWSHRVGCFRAPEIQQRLAILFYKKNQTSLES
jgi:hypothetical protein